MEEKELWKTRGIEHKRSTEGKTKSGEGRIESKAERTTCGVQEGKMENVLKRPRKVS